MMHSFWKNTPLKFVKTTLLRELVLCRTITAETNEQRGLFMISYDKENGLFSLHTKNTTYQMKVWDYNVLLHTYYGPRLEGEDRS